LSDRRRLEADSVDSERFWLNLKTRLFTGHYGTLVHHGCFTLLTRQTAGHS